MRRYLEDVKQVDMNKSFLPEIRVIEKGYEIPQLGRKRRIAALLPHSYNKTKKRYPVLYLHDGQNLFDENAPYGNWGVDKSLAWMASLGFPEVIVIAIDHGKKDRIKEFTPFPNPKIGSAEGKLYLQFLLDTLKPLVDSEFRVLPDGANTGIGGSSMGGLISLYAGLAEPEHFAKWMIFSPSLWIAPKIYAMARAFQPVHHPTSIYLYAGGKESKNLLPNVVRLSNSFPNDELPDEEFKVHLSINPEGTHNEHFWGLEFPNAVRWLFG